MDPSDFKIKKKSCKLAKQVSTYHSYYHGVVKYCHKHKTAQEIIPDDETQRTSTRQFDVYGVCCAKFTAVSAVIVRK
jgi:hypothetical protein